MDIIRRVQYPSVRTKNTEKQLPDIVKKRDVFEGLGRLATQHEIKLKPGFPPVAHNARRIPYRLRDPVAKKLGDMEATGIITRVTEPTDWVGPMVVVSKSNNRLCMDPSGLNKAIQRQ